MRNKRCPDVKMSHSVIVSKRLIPSHSKLTDNGEINHYWKSLMAFWGIRGKRASSSSFHPGCNPRSLSKPLVGRLSTQQYSICLKSDGVRYILFLTTRWGDPTHGVALMIDRSRNMYEVEVAAPEEHFLNGTILEGELVWKPPDETKMTYYVFDGIVLSGESQLSKPFEERLSNVTALTRLSSELRNETDAQILETRSLVMCQFDPNIDMKPKTYVHSMFASRLWKEKNEAEHRVDGLIVQATNAPYTVGTAEDDSCFKWKDFSTIDLQGIPPNLHGADAPLPHRLSDRTVVLVQSRVRATTEQDVIEYHIHITDFEVQLMAIRARPDKTSANGLRVIKATVEDVIHAITPDDISEHAAKERND